MSGSDTKPWEKPWTTQDMVENASNWSLAGDAGLLRYLEDFSEKVLAKAKDTNDRLNRLADDITDAHLSLSNAHNEFMGLHNTQFIESRVYEDDETLPAPSTQTKEEIKQKLNDAERLQEMKQAILKGLAVVDKYYEKVEIPPSDSEDDTDEPSVVFQPVDPYINRPLPYVIGTSEWHKYWHVGLIESSSDSEMDNQDEEFSETESEEDISNKPFQIPGISDSDSDFYIAKPSQNIKNEPTYIENTNMFGTSSGSDTGSAQVNTVTSKFAEELRAKLISVDVNIEPEINRKPIQKSDNYSGGLFSEEPPPVDDEVKPIKSGIFSGGIGLFDDDVDDETDHFWIPKSEPVKNVLVASKTPADLFKEENDESIFLDKEDNKNVPSTNIQNTNLKKPVATGLFDDDDDEGLFSVSQMKAAVPSMLYKSSLSCENPPELISNMETKKPPGNVSLFGNNNSLTSQVEEKVKSHRKEVQEIPVKSRVDSEDKKIQNIAEQTKKIQSIFDDDSPLFNDDIFFNGNTKLTSNIFDSDSEITDKSVFSSDVLRNETSKKPSLLFSSENRPSDNTGTTDQNSAQYENTGNQNSDLKDENKQSPFPKVLYENKTIEKSPSLDPVKKKSMEKESDDEDLFKTEKNISRTKENEHKDIYGNSEIESPEEISVKKQKINITQVVDLFSDEDDLFKTPESPQKSLFTTEDNLKKEKPGSLKKSKKEVTNLFLDDDLFKPTTETENNAHLFSDSAKSTSSKTYDKQIEDLFSHEESLFKSATKIKPEEFSDNLGIQKSDVIVTDLFSDEDDLFKISKPDGQKGNHSNSNFFIDETEKKSVPKPLNQNLFSDEQSVFAPYNAASQSTKKNDTTIKNIISDDEIEDLFSDTDICKNKTMVEINEQSDLLSASGKSEEKIKSEKSKKFNTSLFSDESDEEYLNIGKTTVLENKAISILSDTELIKNKPEINNAASHIPDVSGSIFNVNQGLSNKNLNTSADNVQTSCSLFSDGSDEEKSSMSKDLSTKLKEQTENVFPENQYLVKKNNLGQNKKDHFMNYKKKAYTSLFSDESDEEKFIPPKKSDMKIEKSSQIVFSDEDDLFKASIKTKTATVSEKQTKLDKKSVTVKTRVDNIFSDDEDIFRTTNKSKTNISLFSDGSDREEPPPLKETNKRHVKEKHISSGLFSDEDDLFESIGKPAEPRGSVSLFYADDKPPPLVDLDTDLKTKKNLSSSIFSDEEGIFKKSRNSDKPKMSTSLFSEDSDEDLFSDNLKTSKTESALKSSLKSAKNVSENNVNVGSSTGKIKHNLNINIKALLPGAAPLKNKPQNLKTSNEEEISYDTVPGFPEGTENVDILTSAVKQRVKIPVKRRPSTRKARQEAIRKSGMDFTLDDPVFEYGKMVQDNKDFPMRQSEAEINIQNAANNNINQAADTAQQQEIKSGPSKKSSRIKKLLKHSTEDILNDPLNVLNK